MNKPNSTELSEERTEFAEERTILASERTYAAWVRTGLAAVVSGLAVVRFMRETLPEWALLPVAVALLLFGCFSFAAAAWRYVHMGRSLAQAKMPRFSGTRPDRERAACAPDPGRPGEHPAAVEDTRRARRAAIARRLPIRP